MTFVNGTAEFDALARRCKDAPDALLAEMRTDVTNALVPLQGDVSKSAVSLLPRRGGLGRLIAASPSAIGTNRGAGVASGVRLTTSSGHDIAAMDRGRLRHPLFGDRKHWYTQTVTAGWWSIPVARSKPSIQAAVNRAMENVKQKMEG